MSYKGLLAISSEKYRIPVDVFPHANLYFFYSCFVGGDKIVQTSDDKLFQQLAKSYANKHPTMHLGNPQCPGNAGELKTSLF